MSEPPAPPQPTPYPPPLPALRRFWLAWVCFFRVLFDPAFAAHAFDLDSPRPELPPAPSPFAHLAAPPFTPQTRPRESAFERGARDTTSALQLLALLQRDGRLVDFLEQDVTSFGDAEIGAAARIVHEGCRKALRSHATLVPVRSEDEGTTVSLADFDPRQIKLTGNVRGGPPHRGVLRHRGWRASKLTLPLPVEGHDPAILAPAELEL